MQKILKHILRTLGCTLLSVLYYQDNPCSTALVFEGLEHVYFSSNVSAMTRNVIWDLIRIYLLLFIGLVEGSNTLNPLAWKCPLLLNDSASIAEMYIQ